MRRNRSLDSSSVSAELGSSKRNDARRSGEGTADLGPLLDGERHPVERRLGDIEDGQVREQVAFLGTQAARRSPGALAADHQVLADREVREQLGLLVDHGDAILVEVRVPRLPVEEDLAVVGRASAARILMIVHLPAPLGPAMPRISPGTAHEVQAVERAGVAVPLAQPADDEASLRRRALR